uniref:Fruiting body differentiation protein 16 n=1 Tax=Flammulina velutipes TaxID=38945 RepID=FD16_FLAVE|nr:FVFD16 [Flammulina velutipes]
MLFSHIVFVALSVFGLVQAIPSPLAKEGVVERATNADVTGVLNTLKGRTDTILPQINALVASGNVNDRNVKPLFDQLSSALKTADASLGKFKAQGSLAGKTRTRSLLLVPTSSRTSTPLSRRSPSTSR